MFSAQTGRSLLALALVCIVAAGASGYAISVALRPTAHVTAQTSQPSTTSHIAVLPPVAAQQSASTQASSDALIHRYQLAVRQNPHVVANYLNLALAYMQKYRETSDVTYYTLTDDALKVALRLDPNNYAAINYEAWVHMGRHDFVGAAALARRAIALNPYDPANYGNLGDAEANLGNYGAMAKAYQKMVDLKPDLASYTRASYARWLYGDLRGAFQFMRMAVAAGRTPKENLAWAESQLGDDYLGDGYALPAEQAYAAALHAFPGYARALGGGPGASPDAMAGMAMIDFGQGRVSRAIHDFQRAIAVVPLPQYVVGLGDLYTAVGNRTAAAREYALVRFIDRIFALNHVQYGIEQAMFDADHNQNLRQALRTAEATARVRHDTLTDDTLAWVLYKNGRYAAAWKAEKAALRLGTKYALYYFHAGMIQAALGNTYVAQSFLSSALLLNPNFHVLYAAQARAELQKLAGAGVVRSSQKKHR